MGPSPATRTIHSSEIQTYPGAHHCAPCRELQIAALKKQGRWCDRHGELPFTFRWIDIQRDEFEIEPFRCPICALLEVA